MSHFNPLTPSCTYFASSFHRPPSPFSLDYLSASYPLHLSPFHQSVFLFCYHLLSRTASSSLNAPLSFLRPCLTLSLHLFLLRLLFSPVHAFHYLPPDNSSLSFPVLFFCAPPSNLSVSYYPHSYLSALPAPRLCSTDSAHPSFINASVLKTRPCPLPSRRFCPSLSSHNEFVSSFELFSSSSPPLSPSKQPVLYSVRAVPLHSSLSSLSFPFH